jgi:DNA-binding CsgD family transcriptional regulator
MDTKHQPVLTKRMQEVVNMAVQGKTNQEIANSLGLSPETIKTHIRTILLRTRLRSRAEFWKLSSASFMEAQLGTKILVLGHGSHGKDTVGEIIRGLTGFSFASSSWAALEAIYPALSYVLGEADKNVLYAQRSEHRELWRLLISLYNTPDKSALTRRILSQNDVYIGMRSADEYEASKHLFTHIFWVDASSRQGCEDSMQIMYNPATMHLIDNNGSEKALWSEVKRALVATIPEAIKEPEARAQSATPPSNTNKAGPWDQLKLF